MRRVLVSILKWIGYREQIASELLDSLWAHKGKLLLILTASFTIPLFELGVIGTLYTLVSPDYQRALIDKLSRFGLSGALNVVADLELMWLLLVVIACLMLGLALWSKFVHGAGIAYF